MSIFAGAGNGIYHGAPALSSTTDSFSNPFGLVLGANEDILGNGFTDPIFIDYNGASPTVVASVSDGKGGFTYTTALSSTSVPALSFLQPIAADFNGDGKQDLLIAGTDNSLSVALSKGDGTFLAPVALAMPSLNCEVSYAAAGDLDGDGYTDIVVTYPGDVSCGGSGQAISGYFVVSAKETEPSLHPHSQQAVTNFTPQYLLT